MTEFEYKEKLKDMNRQHTHRVERMQYEYALSKTDVVVGDVITDGHTTLQVGKLQYRLRYTTDVPFPVFRGVLYTKKGLPYKTGEIGVIAGSDAKVVKL